MNKSTPEVSSYLYTELFFADWLKSKGLKYCSIESFNQWTAEVLKTNGIKVTADNFRKSLLVFDNWKENYSTGKMGTKDLEKMLNEAAVAIPNLMDFCEYSQELSSQAKPDKAIALLLYADDLIQHMGQLYAFLGDAYLAKRDKISASENYLKCLKTYPEYPLATEGLDKLKGDLKNLN